MLGRIADIEAAILIPHLRNLKILAADYSTPHEAPDVRGVWVSGKPGTGKTHWARLYYAHLGTAYIKPSNKWWDGYLGLKVVILDDLTLECLSGLILHWADKYPVTGEIKGGNVNLQHHVFIITSNFTIPELFDKLPGVTQDAIRRRFEVVLFSGRGKYKFIPDVKFNRLVPRLVVPGYVELKGAGVHRQGSDTDQTTRVLEQESQGSV